jgi:hypothetical protein
MADLLSQNDLNALLGLTAEDGTSGPAEPAEGTASATPPAGLAPSATPPAGLSQGDLDSLLAGLADFSPAARPKSPVPCGEECAVACGGTLSQEEIDRLLADFGK